MASAFAGDVGELFKKLGFTVSSVEVIGKTVRLKALSVGSQGKFLIVAFSQKKMVGDGVLKKIFERLRDEGFDSAYVVSLKGFTGKALEYAAEKPFELFDGPEFERLLVEHGLREVEGGEDEVFVYESAFLKGFDELQAKGFLRGMEKKVLGLFHGGKGLEYLPFEFDVLTDVECRYAPVAKLRAEVGGVERVFFVDLSDGGLFHVRRDVLKKRLVVEKNDLGVLFRDLDGDGIRILGDVICKREVRLSELAVDVPVDISDRTRILLRLKARKVLDVVDGEDPMVYSNLNIPCFTEKRFDLESFFSSSADVEASERADDVGVDVEFLMTSLSFFFNCNTILEKVVYMPYYQGVYVDSKGRVKVRVLHALKEKES